ncbi:unnamed protein product [Tetraodon nigroviridis]|uniref:PAN2-PAN3 deadenylation complex subunit PAN3 n=1 Tax=Tetraodon nigroviridis TaxID=99883 RepID=Q4S571_TETNG|nr:unnamed protein product [Tetraodon nigroviridis]
MDAASLSDASLTNSYFSSSFIGVNGFGSPAESKYSMMQRMTTSSSSPSLLNEGVKNFSHSTHGRCLTPPCEVVQANPSLYVKLQACLFLLDRPLFTPRRSPPTPRPLPAGAATLPTPPTTWCPPAPRSRAPKSSRRRLWGGPLTFTRTTRRPPWRGWYVLRAAHRRQDGGSSCSFERALSFLSMRKLFFSHFVPGVSYLPYLSLHCTPRGLHAAQSERSVLLYGRRAATGLFLCFHQFLSSLGAALFFPCAHLRHIGLVFVLQELINRHLITMAQIDHSENTDVPSEVDSYHSLFPLEPLLPPNRMQKTGNFSYITSCYKAVNSKDDLPYCLRRIQGFRLVNTQVHDAGGHVEEDPALQLGDIKGGLHHQGLRRPLTEAANAELPWLDVVSAQRWCSPTTSTRVQKPCTADTSTTQQQTPTSPRESGHAGLLPESLIWAYIVQLSSALRTIHTAGLACRVMDPSKILITGKTRLRVNCVGVFDVLTFDNSQTNHLALMPQYQQADLVSLGKVVLALACNSLAGIQRENLQKAMELVSLNYSSDLKNLILYLLTEQSRLRSVNDIMPMIGARFYTQLDASQMRNDVIEEDLAKEVQNGRLFRLLAKLGTINERPEFQKDPAWSETGDRYLLKLFRDHLFHQVTEAGTPWIDLSHIVSCLNKLDAGVPEKISLVSRDEKSVLVVTYSDLKRCFDNTFQELQSVASGSL